MRVVYETGLHTSYQRFILEILSDASVRLFPSFGLKSIQASFLNENNSSVVLLGTFETTDAINYTGMITGFDLRTERGGEPAVKVRGFDPIEFNELFDLAEAISDPLVRPSVDDPDWVNFFAALSGVAGGATVIGAGERDVIDGTANDDLLRGGLKNDNIIASNGSDDINGGGGKKDFWVGKELTAGVNANMADGFVSKDDSATDIDAIANVEGIVGTNFKDLITGDAKANFLFGCDGRDVINGGGGKDKIYGGDVRDILNGNEGNDRIFGGKGSDDIYGGIDNDFLSGGRGKDELYGGKGDDSLSGGTGRDNLNGDEGDDLLEGGSGGDHIDGGIGKDRLFGGNGNDFLDGEGGSDTLRGEEGNDQIEGGVGNDHLYGGFGIDTFVFYDIEGDGTDMIYDFDASEDRISFFDETGLPTVTNVGANSVIDFGSSIAILIGVTLSETDINFIG